MENILILAAVLALLVLGAKLLSKATKDKSPAATAVPVLSSVTVAEEDPAVPDGMKH